jgi:hypothetical protein
MNERNALSIRSNPGGVSVGCARASASRRRVTVATIWPNILLSNMFLDAVAI